MTTDISSVLTPACLKEVRDFWFEHLPHDDELIVPGKTANARWWAGGPEFDTLCAYVSPVTFYVTPSLS